jgi:hypothetical protein
MKGMRTNCWASQRDKATMNGELMNNICYSIFVLQKNGD